MADALKDFFNRDLVRQLARQLRGVYPAFDEARFVSGCTRGLGALELTARAGWIAENLHLCSDGAAAGLTNEASR